MPRHAIPLADRFWASVDKQDGCWLWTRHRNRGGYGIIGVNHHPRQAHRVSWELEHGSIPDGLVVRHRCDNPPCVRPDHLVLGTTADNVHDYWERHGAKRRKTGALWFWPWLIRRLP